MRCDTQTSTALPPSHIAHESKVGANTIRATHTESLICKNSVESLAAQSKIFASIIFSHPAYASKQRITCPLILSAFFFLPTTGFSFVSLAWIYLLSGRVKPMDGFFVVDPDKHIENVCFFGLSRGKMMICCHTLACVHIRDATGGVTNTHIFSKFPFRTTCSDDANTLYFPHIKCRYRLFELSCILLYYI